ncbi:hypothetical protein Brsp01_07210 [Brucella sp. NBRC 12950]|nr:hypothetical protein Brsp01_07210 [Brucella sp. NBRC 12950]
MQSRRGAFSKVEQPAKAHGDVYALTINRDRDCGVDAEPCGTRLLNMKDQWRTPTAQSQSRIYTNVLARWTF